MKKDNRILARVSALFRMREISLLLVLILLCAVIQFRNPSFLTGNVVSAILKNYSYTMILSVGMLAVMLIGGIDISIASTLALSGMASALLMKSGFLPNVFTAYLFSMLVGLLCGLIVGLVIAKGKVLPIIATLGFMYIYRGITYLISGSKWVGTAYLAEDFKNFAQEKFLGINNLVCITIVIFLVFFFALKWTRLGRRVYALGSNPEAASISGIHVDRIKILVYGLNGTLAGLCGAMYVGYYASAQNDMAYGAEMDVIAACVIGGVSLNGGQGSVGGVLLGAITVAVISKSLSLVGIDPFWQQALKGAIILVAVIINVLVQRGIIRRNLERKEI